MRGYSSHILQPAVAIDPEDVDWVTAEFDDNDDMDLQVEEVPRKAIGGEQPRAAAEPFDRDLVLKVLALSRVLLSTFTLTAP